MTELTIFGKFKILFICYCRSSSVNCELIRLLRYMDKYRYFLNIDISIVDFSIFW